MESREVIIVGAGPAGTAAALALRRLGVGEVLLLDRARFPRDKVCAGGLSVTARDALRRLDVWTEIEHRAQPIYALRLVTPAGRQMEVRGPGHAWVLPRRELDARLLAAVRAAGVEVREGCKADGLLLRDGRVVGVRCGEEHLAARWVVHAGGAHARLGLAPTGGRLLATCLARYEGVECEPGRVEMIWDRDLGGHYGWLFPEGASRANVGLCLDHRRLGGHSVRALFARFVERHFGSRLAAARVIDAPRGHPIRCRGLVRLHDPAGLLRCGEAAALVNPATGEGIAAALVSGSLAAEAVNGGRRLGAGATGAWYQARLGAALGPGLALGWAFLRWGVPLLDVVAAGRRLPGVSWLTSGALSRMS